MDEWKQLYLRGLEEREFPLSLENARVLLLNALVGGKVHVTKHFRERGVERGFTTVDAERVIRSGNFACPPKFDEAHENWVFRIAGKCDTRNFEVRVALDWSEDLEYPLAIYVTGICKKGERDGTQQPKRRQRRANEGAQ